MAATLSMEICKVLSGGAEDGLFGCFVLKRVNDSLCSCDKKLLKCALKLPHGLKP